MKNRTHCPSCAAPLEIGEVKCPYCGTIYYDLSTIDFDSQEPIYLTIRKGGYLITQKVLPQTATFEHQIDTTYATNPLGDKLLSFVTNNTLETNVQFIALPDEKNILMKVQKDG